MNDNKRYHYTEKEIEKFVDMWNQGTPTSIIAEEFRRTPGSVTVYACSLRNRGYDLKPDQRRKEATKLWKKANQPKGTYHDQYDYLSEEDEFNQSDPEVEVNEEPVKIDMPEYPGNTASGSGYTDKWEDDECGGPEDVPVTSSRMEVVTIITIDGREVSRSTSTTYL